MKTASDIVKGLMSLHLLDIVHNDVKPANVLTFADDKADFGCDFGALVLEAWDSKKEWPGPKYWAAPETYYDIREHVDVMKQWDICLLGMKKGLDLSMHLSSTDL
jgi:serine/threonine protein kinase